MGEYNQLKGLLSAAARKSTGSLAVRDLFGIVDPVDVRLESEYMTVLLVVVAKYSMKEWETTYEGLNQFVVRSTTQGYFVHNMACWPPMASIGFPNVFWHFTVVL